MKITYKSIAKIINRSPGYVRVLLTRKGIKLRHTKKDTCRLSDNYISNLEKLITLFKEQEK